MTEKHIMPALTDEDRADLHSFLTDSKIFVYTEAIRLEKLRDKIALAALAAEPVAWRHDNGPFGKVATCSIKAADSWRDIGFSVTPLYTAPSVPALKMPDELPENIPFAVHRIEAKTWNRCLAEVKRMNGVKQ